MKTLKTILIGIFLISIVPTAHAQFFKKLKKKLERKVEDAVTDKISDKAAEKASKSVDAVFDFDLGANGSLMMGSTDDLPESYDFGYVYSLEITSPSLPQDKNTMLMDYYLKKDAPYWGTMIKTDQKQELVMVYDDTTQKMAMFMKMDGKNMVTVTDLNKINSFTEHDVDADTNMEFKNIDGKTILGYDCDGFMTEDQDRKITMYITYDAPVSFMKAMTNTKMAPKNMNTKWLVKDGRDALVMQMVMEDKKKPKENVEMNCIGLEQKSFSIKKADYTGIAQN